MENLLYLVDSDIGFKRIGTLDSHVKSFNWSEDMGGEDGGSFSIVLNGGKLRPLLKTELFVENTKGKKLGFITSIKVKKNKGAIEEITVSGKMMECILGRRRVKSQMQLQGTAKEIITDLITVNVINTKSTILNIPIKINFIGNIPSDTCEYGFEDGKKVSEALKEICVNLNLFYFFTVEDGAIVLNIKKCDDKEYIVFASDDSNLYDITILDTIENKANCVIVKGDIINNSVPYSYSVLSGKTGIHVSEDFLDVSNLDSKDVESSLYLKMMKKKGNNQLMSYQVSNLLDSCTLKNKYIYPVEIFLGDVVSVYVEGNVQRQRLVSFLHCLNSNKKEEFIFTLAQMPEMLSTTDEEYVFEDVPKEEQESPGSDISTPNINPDSTGGGSSGSKQLGRVVCIDDKRVDGSVIELEDKSIQLTIFTWNGNPTSTITNEDGTITESIKKIPYMGKIYIRSDIDLLSYIDNETDTLDIINADGSLTQIFTKTGIKGVLYRDKLAEGYPIIFENPTEQNADDDAYYEYDIVSENMNFNAKVIISTKAVAETIPLKTYSKVLRIPLKSMILKTWNNLTYRDDFHPDNFTASEGDYIQLKCNYAPFTHTNDPANPYICDKSELEERIFTWTFRQGEKVANKYITLEEGYYDFVGASTNGWGFSSHFEKLEYLKTLPYGAAEGHGYMVIKRWDETQQKYIDISVNGYFIIRQDPAFDSIEGLTEPRWSCFEPNINKNPYKVSDFTHWPLQVFLATQIKKSNGDAIDPSTLLEDMCDGKIIT